MKDGDAWTGEVAGHGCLTDAFLRRKKSYCDLMHLIHKEWNTSFCTETNENGVFSFEGFKGKYKITVGDKNSTEHSVFVTLNSPSESVTVEL